MAREAWWGGGGGELFEGCNFYIFPSDGGNYSREAINQGTAIIWWNTVNPILCSYWWPEQARWVCLNLPSQDFLHCSHKKNVKSVAHNKSFIDLAWGQDNWIYICQFFFSIIIHLKPNFVFVNKNPKKNYGQYCAILTSKVVNSNAYFCSKGCLAFEQALLFGLVKWAMHVRTCVLNTISPKWRACLQVKGCPEAQCQLLLGELKFFPSRIALTEKKNTIK